MIVDELSRLDRYRGLSPRLDQSIAFLQTTDLRALPVGRVEIDGDHIFGTHLVFDTAPLAADKRFEIHLRYIDIQIILSGCESIALAPRERLAEVEERKAEDIAFYQGPPDHVLMVRGGSFVLLFPGEAHMPGLAAGDPSQVEKLVLKVAY